MTVVNGKLQIARNTLAENIKAGNIDPSQSANFRPVQQQYHQQQQQQETQVLTPEQQKHLKKVQALNYLANLKKQADQKRAVQSVKSTKLQFST